MTFWVLVFIAEMLEVKGTLYFFDTFMEKRRVWISARREAAIPVRQTL